MENLKNCEDCNLNITKTTFRITFRSISHNKNSFVKQEKDLESIKNIPFYNEKDIEYKKIIPFEDFDENKEELEKRKFLKERIIEDLENYFENKRKQLSIKIKTRFKRCKTCSNLYDRKLLQSFRIFN
jgi:hypothetical protein